MYTVINQSQGDNMPEHASKTGTEKQQREPAGQEEQFAPETGSPLQTQIFQLQRLIGNKATQRYLQTGSTRIQRELDDEETQAAINHYHAIIDSGAIEGD